MPVTAECDYATWWPFAILRMLEALRAPTPVGEHVLDFGCGAGGVVQSLRGLGVEAFGVDFADALPATTAPHLFAIGSPYRLPFDDDSFDLIVSLAVFEHVMDYPAALGEIRRVLRPGGATLHCFASRWSPIEQHVNVPLAGVVRSRKWLKLWALAGVRNEFQRGMSADAVADKNHRYLIGETNYPSRRQIIRSFRHAFPNARFAEKQLHKARGGVRATLSHAPLLPSLAGLLHTNAVYATKEE